MGSLGPTELIIIGLIIILLFGAKKLPDTARALGQSMRLFKKETQKMREEDDDKSTVVTAQAETVTPQPAATTPPAQILRLFRRPRSKTGCVSWRRRTRSCGPPRSPACSRPTSRTDLRRTFSRDRIMGWPC